MNERLIPSPNRGTVGSSGASMAFEVRLLGSVEALSDGHSLSLGGSKQRSVVAMLALNANTTLSGERLIDGLWGEHPPTDPAKNVQHYVWRLRKLLAESGADVEIVTRGQGYELRLPAHAVDALRFERLVEEAARETTGGATNGASRSALELWRGAPLSDVADEPFALPEIRRLEELHLKAHELAIDADLAAGRHAEVSAELEALIAEEPLRERFHAQRMLALYRDGRQSEALDAYRVARETLIEQIGVEPGPELQDLQAAILDQDPRLDAPPAIQELPAQLEGGSPVLAGRERELAWLRERWERASKGGVVVALIGGPAGIGKTRLVAELATEVQSGGGVVLCAGGGDVPEAALATVGRASKSERPVLLVLDYADDAPPAVLRAASELASDPSGHSLLICVLHHDQQGPPAFAALLDAGAAERLRLDRLSDSAVAEIAELYAPAEGVAMPLPTLIAASEGVPLRVHRAAGDWARSEVAEGLVGAAGRAADERTGLRAAEADLAGKVIDLQAAGERIRTYAVEEPADTAVHAVCPFRGLAPFDAAHAEYFFGRERLVAELVARLVGSTLLAVVGPSGSGKSSAVRAGLLPALAGGVVPDSEGWRQAVMRPGERPLAELSRTLARVVPGAENGSDRAPPAIAAVLDRLAAGERLVVVVDQFEEVFFACRDAVEREAFLDVLVEGAGDPDERLLVVIAMRADFYADCAQHVGLSTLIGSNQVLVGPMRRDELRRAIELPARKSGLRVEPRLVSALVGDVAGEPGGLPLLSAALLELWQRRSGRTLRYEAYEHSGGVQGAVARLAEAAYQRLSEAERRRARPLLLRLAGDDEEGGALVRRRVTLSELEVDRDENAAGALAVLTESRLLTSNEDTVEVAHEALLREWPRLRTWLEEDAEGRRLHQHLIGASREWRDSGDDPAELYRGARLASALDWAEGHDPELNELEREFLEESRAASQREAERQRRTNRRLRALLLGVGALLTLAVVAGVIARSERESARSAATAEAAQRLGAQALNEDRLDQALLLANTGAALDDSVASRSSLLSTLLRNPAALGVLRTDGDELFALALSPDGRRLALGDSDGTVVLFDAETRERLGDYRAPGYVTDLAFDPRGRSLAIVAKNEATPELTASLSILDADTLRLRSSNELGRRPGIAVPQKEQDYKPTVTYPSDGRSVVVGYVNLSPSRAPLFLRRFDAGSGSALGSAVPVAPAPPGLLPSEPVSTPEGRLLYPTPKTTYAIDAETLRVVRRYPLGGLSAGISADGATLAIGNEDGRVRLLDLPSGRVQTLSERHEAPVTDAVFTPDGRTLVTADDDGTVIVRDLRTGEVTETLAGHGDAVLDQAVGPDGRTLYTGSIDSTAIIWDLAGDRRLGRPFTTGLARIRKDQFPPAFAVSPDGRALAVARLDGRVDLIDAQTLQRTRSFQAFRSFEGQPTPAAAIEYTPDGRQLAVAGGHGLVGLWDARSGQRVGPLLHAPSPHGRCAQRSWFTFACFSATVQTLAVGRGGLLAAAGVGGTVRIWDLGSRELTGQPMHLPDVVAGVAFSPGGSQLAVTTGFGEGNPNAIEVRDPRSGERIVRLPTENDLRSVAFSPDGTLLAVGHVDGSAVLWETDGWRQAGAPLTLSAAPALGVAFSPDGRTLATSHDDGAVVLWDVASRQPIGAPLPGGFHWVTARFTPDGRRLFAVYDIGTAMRWEVDPAVWRQHACTVGGGLTPEQWEEVVPEQDYIEFCPSGGDT
jgi:WD40 repeat protein/DNA-binding SARP family transcriptional activator